MQRVRLPAFPGQAGDRAGVWHRLLPHLRRIHTRDQGVPMYSHSCRVNPDPFGYEGMAESGFVCPI